MEDAIWSDKSSLTAPTCVPYRKLRSIQAYYYYILVERPSRKRAHQGSLKNMLVFVVTESGKTTMSTFPHILIYYLVYISSAQDSMNKGHDAIGVLPARNPPTVVH